MPDIFIGQHLINIYTELAPKLSATASGPSLGLIMYIFMTLEFPIHNFDAKMHASYFDIYIYIYIEFRLNVFVAIQSYTL